jgi:predicted DCC family thiol-disulfide oxidoreductase YuxK
MTPSATANRDVRNGWTGGQYSLARALLAIATIPWLWSALSGGGGHNHALGPWFPNVLPYMADSAGLLGVPAFAYAAVATLLAVLVALGRADRLAAFLLAYALLCVRDISPPLSGVAGWPVAESLLIVHGLVPGAPYGSLRARGRTDPGAGFTFPHRLYAAAWVVVGLGHLAAGIERLLAPGWHTAPLPAVAATALLCALSVAALPLATSPRLRPVVFLALVGLQLAATLSNPASPGHWMVLAAHLFLFDPAWLPARRTAAPEHVFYDGSCALCHGAVRFLLAEDPDGAAFRFAALQSDTFESLVPAELRATLPDSIVVRTESGTLLLRAAAIRHLLTRLGGLWRIISAASRVIPLPLADRAYDLVARVRYRFFGKKADACPMMPAELRARFAP